MVAAEGWREEVFPQLLPPMCLNRRYEAEGVRLYSQRTWALILGDQGRHWVARCAPHVCFKTLHYSLNLALPMNSTRAW